MTISGTERTAVLPVDPPSGDSCWWGNRGDNIDATLTQLSGPHGPRPGDAPVLDLVRHRGGMGQGVRCRVRRRRSVVDARSPAATRPRPTPDRLFAGPLLHRKLGRLGAGRRSTSRRSPGRPCCCGSSTSPTTRSQNTGWCVADISIERLDLSDGEWTANGFIDLSAEGVSQRFRARLVTGAGAEAQVTNVPFDSSNRAEFTV